MKLIRETIAKILKCGKPNQAKYISDNNDQIVFIPAAQGYQK